jgi:hypothetical protein
MYTPSQFLKGLRNPDLVKLELVVKANQLYEKYLLNHSGENFMENDWDNLILLDSCRYDVFQDVNSIPGKFRIATSPAAKSREFYQHHFEGKTFEDTVIITANPHIGFIKSEVHNFVPLWETEYWDHELNTTHPKDVVDKALELNEQYPNKRLFIHFVQPHVPFIGPKGREIDHQGMGGGELLNGRQRELDSVWNRVIRGKLDHDEVWDAYVENLEMTMPHIEQLVDKLHGKSVISADHGQAFGEWGQYGHGSWVEPVYNVPWFEVESDDRKTITKGEETVSTYMLDSDEEEITARLQDLGYLE